MYIFIICAYFIITAVCNYISTIIGFNYLTSIVSAILALIIFAKYSKDYDYDNRYFLNKPKTVWAIFILFMLVGLLGNITEMFIFGIETPSLNAAVSVITASFTETVIFQVLPLAKITNRQSAITVSSVVSVIFALFHLFCKGEANTTSIFLSIAAFAFCLAACFITYCTKNPLFAFVAHFAINFSGIFVNKTSIIACSFVGVIYLILAYIIISDSREKNNEILH